MANVIKIITPILELCQNYEHLLSFKKLFDICPEQILTINYYDLTSSKLETLLRLCDNESDFKFYKTISKKTNKELLTHIIIKRNWEKGTKNKIVYLEKELYNQCDRFSKLYIKYENLLNENENLKSKLDTLQEACAVGTDFEYYGDDIYNSALDKLL